MLNLTVKLEREKLQAQMMPCIERWECAKRDEDEVTMVVTMRDTASGPLKKWQTEKRDI